MPGPRMRLLHPQSPAPQASGHTPFRNTGRRWRGPTHESEKQKEETTDPKIPLSFTSAGRRTGGGPEGSEQRKGVCSRGLRAFWSHLGPVNSPLSPKMVAAPGGRAARGGPAWPSCQHYTVVETLHGRGAWVVPLVSRWNDTSKRVWDVGRHGHLLVPLREQATQNKGIVPACHHHHPGPARPFHRPQEPFPHCLPAQEPWRALPHPPSVCFHGGTTAKKPDLRSPVSGRGRGPRCHCTLETACLVGSQGPHPALQVSFQGDTAAPCW